MIKAAFVATVGVATAYVIWLTSDVIVAFANEAADLALLSGRVCLGSVVFVIAVTALWWLRRQSYQQRRMVDGAWAVEYYWLVPWTVRIVNMILGRVSPRGRLDPNAAISPLHVISDAIYTPEPAAGWDRHERYAIAQEGANKLRAISAGDGAVSLPWVGHAPRSPMNAPTARLMAGAYDKPVKAAQPDPAPAQLPAPAPRTWTPEAALNLNTRTKLAMGATPTGERVLWDMTKTPHLRVHGMTQGSGKTNLIQTVATGACRTGAQVIVCDRRRFKDWADFQGRAELVATNDPQQFVQAILRLRDIYQERDALLGQHGAPNILALPDPPQRIVMIVSEFGALCATAADSGMLDDILYPLQLVLREAGATGVHVVIEDQVVDRRWPRGISTNAEPVTGYLPVNYGSAGGYYDAHKLQPYTFHFSGRTFGTWPMAPVLATLLAYVRPVTVDGRSSVPGIGEGGRSLVVERQNDAQNVPPGTDDPGRWDAVVDAWFAANPQALTGPAKGISDLARAMCTDDTGNADNYEAYKGRAHALFHAFRDAVRVGGDKIGVDVTHGINPVV